MNRSPSLPAQVYERADESKDYDIPFGFYATAFGKARRLVLTIVAACLLLAIPYALTRQPVFEATAIIGPGAAASTGPKDTLSSLAASAGFAVNTGNNANVFDKYQHLLQATRLAEMLEQRQHVMRRLYAPLWDARAQRWKPPAGLFVALLSPLKAATGSQWQPPTTQSLAEMLRRMVVIHQPEAGSGGLAALKSQLITVSLRYRDRQFAIALLNDILLDADILVRRDQLEETQNRIAYLEDALRNTSVVSLSNNLTQILGDQERVLMMVKADRYYAFDMVDPPNASFTPVGLGKMQILMLSIVFGLVVSAGAVFFMVRWRVARYVETGEHPFARPFPDPIGGSGRAVFRLFGVSRGQRQSPLSEPSQSPQT